MSISIQRKAGKETNPKIKQGDVGQRLALAKRSSTNSIFQQIIFDRLHPLGRVGYFERHGVLFIL